MNTSFPRLQDSRRLTGANLFWASPAAIIDASFSGDRKALRRFIADWEDAVTRILSALDVPAMPTCTRCFDGGLSLLIAAPIDALYSMCEVNELAFAMAQTGTESTAEIDFLEQVQRLQAEFHSEANPPLLALQEAAATHGVPFLWDDDLVSVGYGATALQWAPDALPAPEEIAWESVGSVPVALVTGTNGKSTTVRMAAAMIAAQNLNAGLTSTDWIRVGDNILDRGDYSGTGGARTLLRHPDTQLAVLETARGGLLRRGLGVETASAALITNVAADHLGDYGIMTVPDLIEAKFIVRRALRDAAPLILNADDEGIVAFAASLEQPLIWFSLAADNPHVLQARQNGESAAILDDGWLCLVLGDALVKVVRADSIPATKDGAARHNIANALAAMLICRELGITEDSMVTGLQQFRGDEADNPGRGNWFEKDGVRILVDFAHNEHGMLALADMLSRMPAERRMLLISQAGDRSDKDITDMATAACGMRPDRVFLCDLPGYERGRGPSDVADLIREATINSGVAREVIEHHANPGAAVEAALKCARDGDLLVLLVLTQRDEVLKLIHQYLDA